jgi:NodT family efflux transporter outer membrane factor (OMF) lipoprotein
MSKKITSIKKIAIKIIAVKMADIKKISNYSDTSLRGPLGPKQSRSYLSKPWIASLSLAMTGVVTRWAVTKINSIKRYSPSLTAITLLFLLSSCAVGPDYVTPCVEIPEKYKEAAPGWKKAQPQDDCDRRNWWASFHDPVLSKLLKEVDISNQNIKIAEAQFRQACAIVGEAKSAFFPTITGSVSDTRQRISTSGISNSSDSSNVSSISGSGANLTTGTIPIAGTGSGNNSSSGGSSANFTRSNPFTSYNFSLNASWMPDLWGGLRRNLEAAEAGAEASEAQVASVRLSMQATLAQFYYQIRNIDADQKLLDDAVRDYTITLRLTQNRYKAGTNSQLDILQAETQLKTAEAQAIDNGINRALFEHAIAVLIGKPPSCFTLARRPLISEEPPKIPAGFPSTLLERRPDIAQAERLAAQANAQIGVAIAAFFPNLTLTASDGFLSNHFKQWFTSPARFWTLGAQLAGTIFDGGFRIAATDAAIAAYDQNVANYRQVVLTAFQNVEDNLSTLRLLKSEKQKQIEVVKYADSTLKIVLNRYKSGTAQYSDVVVAQTTLYTAKKTLADLNGRQMVATVSLIAALGGGWDQY